MCYLQYIARWINVNIDKIMQFRLKHTLIVFTLSLFYKRWFKRLCYYQYKLDSVQLIRILCPIISAIGYYKSLWSFIKFYVFNFPGVVLNVPMGHIILYVVLGSLILCFLRKSSTFLEHSVCSFWWKQLGVPSYVKVG